MVTSDVGGWRFVKKNGGNTCHREEHVEKKNVEVTVEPIDENMNVENTEESRAGPGMGAKTREAF